MSIVLVTLALIAILTIALMVLPRLWESKKVPLSADVRSRLPATFARLPEGFVHYELAGPHGAQVVVLVHGFAIPGYIWDPTLEALVAGGFRVVRYDLFGRGYSDRPDLIYGLEIFQKQLLDLLDLLEILRPVDLVGMSTGAAIAASFAAAHPQRVRKLVFIGPQHAGTRIFPFNVPLLGDCCASAFFVPLLVRGQTRYFYRPERFPELPGRFREQMRYRGFRRALLSTFRNILGKDQLGLYQRVAKFNKPTLLIWGKEDRIFPFSSHGRVRHALEAEFFPVEEAGHLVGYEQSEIVNAKLVKFLHQ